jgi:phage terminase small subunit
MKAELTPKQQRFIQEYLVDLNGTQAAIRAKYSEKTANEQAARLLANVSIQEAIAEAQQKRSERTEITQDMVLKELARIGFAQLTDFVAWGGEAHDSVCKIGGEEGIQIVDNSTLIASFTKSTDLTPDQAAAIAELSITKEGSVKLKLHDKKGALDSIGKHLGMFTDKVESSGEVKIVVEHIDAANKDTAS